MPRIPDKIRTSLQDLPDRPGVYVMRDRFGQVIYVGKARSLRKRVRTYFQPSARARNEPKTRSLVSSVADIQTFTVKNEPEAMLLEGKLIKEYRPRYNISFRDDKRFLLVKADLQERFPRFRLTRLRKDDGCVYFGPFAHAKPLRHTLRVVQRRFRVRACTPDLPTERDYRHCLDHVMRHCSAPCIGKVGEEEYRALVQEACEFLAGKSREMLDEMQREMEAAAEARDFERAALLRDCLGDLRTTVNPARAFERRLPGAADPARELAELALVLGVDPPPRTVEAFDISTISGTLSVGSMIRFRDGRPDRSAYRRFRIREVEGMDDFAMMREVVRRRYSRLLADGGRPPDAVLIDGGKGQVSAALEALGGLGLTIQVFGLAKRFEEIVIPGRKDAVRLPEGAPALRLVQRIRDEAHRFAVNYHRGLREKTIRDSSLDEIEGIGPVRKKALLTAFGSVDRLRRAGIEELAAVPGVGPKMAQTIFNAFHRSDG